MIFVPTALASVVAHAPTFLRLFGLPLSLAVAFLMEFLPRPAEMTNRLRTTYMTTKPQADMR